MGISPLNSLKKLIDDSENSSTTWLKRPWQHQIVTAALKATQDATDNEYAELKILAARIKNFSDSHKTSYITKFFSALANRYFNHVWISSEHILQEFSKSLETSVSLGNAKIAVDSKLNSGLFKSIVRGIILPGTYEYSKEYVQKIKEGKNQEGRYFIEWKRSLKDCFEFISGKAKTSDGEFLSVTLIKHRNSDKITPTVILFNENCGLSDLHDQAYRFAELSKFNKIPCNFVVFDYRGVGESTGLFEATQDLVIDGVSIVKFVEKELKTSKDRIHFYGRSLGGAIAAKTHASCPDITGNHVNVCSLSSIEKVINAWAPKFIANSVNKMVKHYHYDVDVVDSFKSIKGQKLIVYHPNDRIIPSESGLHEQIKTIDEIKKICLKAKGGYGELSLSWHHNADLSWHVSEGDDDTAECEIFRFLLGSEYIEECMNRRSGKTS